MTITITPEEARKFRKECETWSRERCMTWFLNFKQFQSVEVANGVTNAWEGKNPFPSMTERI